MPESRQSPKLLILLLLCQRRGYEYVSIIDYRPFCHILFLHIYIGEPFYQILWLFLKFIWQHLYKKKKKIALLIFSRVKGQQMVFSKNWKLWIYHLLQYIAGKYFLHWFLEKSIRNSNYRIFLYKAVIYQQNGIIDLVNSKVTIVCAIMTCFINYDVINLYDVMSYILISKRFVSG